MFCVERVEQMKTGKFPTLFIAAVFAGFIFFPHLARSDDPLSPEQTKTLLQELKSIQDVLNGKRVSLRTSAVNVFRSAAASDKAVYEFYLQCHKTLKFDPRDASFSEFRDWRNKNEDRVKTKSNLAAMRLQLQYLVLTLRAAEGVERDVIVPELEAFVGNIVGHASDLGSGGMRTLRSSVKGTIFAQAYDLNRSLETPNWSYSPGDFAGVYEKTIFPYVREVKPAELGVTWDRRINLEKNYVMALQQGNDPGLEKFQTERLPRLYWQKSTDIFLNWSQKEGAAEKLRLIKTYATHPDVEKWVRDFQTLLTPKTTTPPPVPITPSTKSAESNLTPAEKLGLE